MVEAKTRNAQKANMRAIIFFNNFIWDKVGD
jgi:hypothetical protein